MATAEHEGWVEAPWFVRSSATLRRAFTVAADAHEGQTGTGGTWPYLRHPVRVAEILHDAGVGETALAAALLHDVVEHTELTVDTVAERFGAGVADLVAALTEDPRIGDWVARKNALRAQVEAAGADAATIYIADKLANLRDMRRLYAEHGERSIDLHKAPTLDLRVATWRADAEMVERVAPGNEVAATIAPELDAFDAERRAAGFCEGPWRRSATGTLRSMAATAIDVVAPLLLIAVAAGYAHRVSTLARREAPVALWRQISFGGGILVLLIADLPPLADVAEELVVGHMAQHLLIGDLAGLLVALGLTGPVLQPVLAIPALGWLRAFGNPLVALPVWAASLYTWHLAVLYEGVLTSPLLHVAQHLCFFTFGLAMWMPIVGPLPKPAWFGDGAMLLYIVAVRMLEAVLANVFIWSGEVFYPDYAPGEAEWDIGPLADQGAAGNVMMIWTGAVTLGLFAWLFFRAANRSAEKQELLELAESKGVDLDPSRAARAVAAGQGDRLRERILGGKA